MKRLSTLIYFVFISVPLVFSQAYSENFESYTANSYVGPQSSLWTTWSSTEGTPEDALVVKTKSASGSQSLYFHSYSGGGPQDVVLPFGGPYTSGKFKFTANFFVSKDSAAYFNFQGGSTIGVSWPIEFYMYSNGSFNVGSISGNYPQGRWFEIKIEIDLTNNNWEVFFDNVSQGSWKNTINSVSFIDIFDSDPNTEFWIDDITYCLNNDCNPELSIEQLTINPNPVCSNHSADVTVKVKNNSSIVATQMDLAIDMAGQARISKVLNLKKLVKGKDTTITIQGLFKTNIIGSGKIIKAINMSKDPLASDDTAKTTLTILPSPSGAKVIKGSPFQGVFLSGSLGQPDLIETGKTNTYELNPPTGYTNFNYNSTWVISALTVMTSKGSTVPSSAYTITAPNTTSGANGIISFKGSLAYLDSTLVFSATLSNKTTGCDSTVIRVLRVVPTPRPNFKFTTPACDGTPIVFENKSTIHSGYMVYKWYYGDGDSNDFEGPVHVYPTFGTYCVKLVATSMPYMISHDTTICLVISEIPKIAFKVTNACEGKNLSFLNQTTIGTGTLAFDWDFGDATAHSQVKNPTHLYSLTGSYKVTLKATSNTNCVSTLTKNANQFLRPKADFTTKGNCSNNNVEFTNLSKIDAGDNFGSHWEFGDGELNNEKDPIHIYESAGTFAVKYVAVSQFGCTDSIIKNVVIVPSPDASFTNGQVCNIDPVEFTNTTFEPAGVLVNYLWKFGDGGTSNLKNPKHPYPDLGLKTVTLAANGNNGCSTSVSKNIKVLLQPVAAFSANDACAGTSVVFSNKTKGGGIITYRWKFGDGDSSSLYFPTKTYSTTIATTYNVTLTASTLGGCQNSISIPVTIKAIPKCTYKFASAGTGGFEYKFTPTVATYPFYQWSFEGGGISNASSPTHKFQTNGTFRVRVMMKTVDGCDCIDSTQFVTVNNLGIKTFESKSGISFYPNPNKGEFNLQVSSVSPTEPFTLNILDLTGRLINTSTLMGDAQHTISLAELATGLYTLEIIKQSGDRVTAKMNVIK